MAITLDWLLTLLALIFLLLEAFRYPRDTPVSLGWLGLALLALTLLTP